MIRCSEIKKGAHRFDCRGYKSIWKQDSEMQYSADNAVSASSGNLA